MGAASQEPGLQGSVQGYLAASGIAGSVSAAVNAAVKARAPEPCSFIVRPPPPPPPTSQRPRAPRPAPRAPRASARERAPPRRVLRRARGYMCACRLSAWGGAEADAAEGCRRRS